MVSITVGDKTIEAETLKEATRLAKKEEKAQAQAEKDAEAKRDVARLKASKRMLALIDTIGERLSTPTARRGQVYAGADATTEYAQRLYARAVTTKTDSFSSSSFVRIETEHGEKTILTGYRILGVVENSAGWMLALHVQDATHPEIEAVWSAGIHDGEYAIVSLPEFLLPQFRQTFVMPTERQAEAA